MVAPTGYSVQVAQGTGLGPKAQGPVMGSQTPTSVDPNALPPVIPTAPSFPASTGTAGSPKGSGIPPSVATSKQPGNNNNADLFDEPDIFIPGSSATEKKDDNDDDDDDNDNNENAAGGGGDDSYSNLAARFSQLQK